MAISSRWISIGATSNRHSNAFVGVVLMHPLVITRARRCTFSRDFISVGFCVAVHQTTHAYASAGLMTAVYIQIHLDQRKKSKFILLDGALGINKRRHVKRYKGSFYGFCTIFTRCHGILLAFNFFHFLLHITQIHFTNYLLSYS